MAVENLDRIICEHPVFHGLGDQPCLLISGCAKNVRFEKGEYLCREGESADWFYLLRAGSVALEMAAPAKGVLTFQSLHEGELVGVSWLLPPYRWGYDARATERVRAVAMDARCLRAKIEDDHELGFQLMMRFTPILVERLHGTRLQLLDVYAPAARA
ncbi:MAG: cyclic nucleotide-binding domain-containing protein [Azospirillaceae bacterium]